MKQGYFFLVVGPSGAGKDSLMDGARGELPEHQFLFARRTITRPPGMPGEDYESCTPTCFRERQARGDFMVTWLAHGYQYGLETALKYEQANGRHIIANGSREIIKLLSQAVTNLIVIHVTAPADVLIQRLTKRGRETEKEIRERMSRNHCIDAPGVRIIEVINDSSLQVGVQRFIDAIQTAIDTKNSV